MGLDQGRDLGGSFSNWKKPNIRQFYCNKNQMKNENQKSLSSGLTPAKNTNVGDKSLEYQRGDPWKNKIFFSKKFSDLNKNRLKIPSICPPPLYFWHGSNLKIEISSFHFSSCFCCNKIACYQVSSNLKITPLSPSPG